MKKWKILEKIQNRIEKTQKQIEGVIREHPETYQHRADVKQLAFRRDTLKNRYEKILHGAAR